MAKEKIDDITNQLRVEQLVKSREEKGFTQEEMAKKSYMGLKNYQGYEYHQRWINEESVEPFAKALNYSIDYMLCKSDLKTPNNLFIAGEDDNYTKSLKKIIEIIELATDQRIRFHYQRINPSNDYKDNAIEHNTKELNEAIEFMESQKMDSEYIEQYKKNYPLTRLNHITTIDKLEEFTLEPICKVRHDKGSSEVVIRGVEINGGYISYGDFIHFIKTIHFLINNTIDNFLEFSTSVRDSISCNESIKSVLKAFDNNDFSDNDNLIDSMKKAYLESYFQRQATSNYFDKKNKKD